MATPRRALLPVAVALWGGGCSVGNQSYAEVERDLDALVRIEGSGDGQRLVYQDRAEMTPWYARAALLLPFKWLFVAAFGDATATKLENPSGQVRDLVAVLAPKAGADLLRGAATAQRLVRMAELDASALNRIVALDGLEVIADVQDIELAAGLENAQAQPGLPPDLPALLDDFKLLRPAGRTAPLPADAAARYTAVLQSLVARPLPQWTTRLALLADLATALEGERQSALRQATDAALRAALGHAIRWTLVGSLQGQDHAWVQVRIRALEILHRAAGPDGVPLLLALMASPPERVAEGQPRFDPDPDMRLRLIHLCGQLNRERAVRAVRLPGRSAWEPVAPVDFLVEMVLVPDPFQSPLQLPAQEALARCLGRQRLGLDPAALSADGSADSTEWVRTWYSEHRRSS